SAVVHVQNATPCYAAQVQFERVAPVDVVVDHRAQQVVCAGDGVEVTREVQVDFVHRHDLALTAASAAALNTEARAEARFAQAKQRALADAAQCVMQTNRGGGLAFAGRSRVDCGDENQLTSL